MKKHFTIYPKNYVRASEEDEWSIEDEYPYTMTLAGKDLNRWDADCWAYYIAKKFKYDQDKYYSLLDDINNLQAYEWIEYGDLDGLDKEHLDAFKKFCHYGEDDEDEE